MRKKFLFQEKTFISCLKLNKKIFFNCEELNKKRFFLAKQFFFIQFRTRTKKDFSWKKNINNLFLPNFFFTQLMDEGKKSENIFFTEVVSWKLPFQEGIFTCVTKWKNVFLEKTSFNLSSFISCVTLGKTIKNLNFSFSCVSDFFSPQEKTFSSLSETGWKKHFQDLFIFFFRGIFTLCETEWNKIFTIWKIQK